MSNIIRLLARLFQFRKLRKLMGYTGPGPVHDDWELIPLDMALDRYLYMVDEGITVEKVMTSVNHPTVYVLKLKETEPKEVNANE